MPSTSWSSVSWFVHRAALCQLSKPIVFQDLALEKKIPFADSGVVRLLDVAIWMAIKGVSGIHLTSMHSF